MSITLKLKTMDFKNEDKIDIDERILLMMSKGMVQREISEEFKRLGITPNSTSIIEKRLRKLRKRYSAKTNFQLAFKCYEEYFLNTKKMC